LHALFSLSRDAIIAFDTSRTIVLFNPAAEETFGGSALQVIGSDLFDLFEWPSGLTSAPQTHAANEPTPAEARSPLQEVCGRRKNGDRFPAELFVAESRLGDFWLGLAIVRDLSAVRPTDARPYDPAQRDDERQKLARLGGLAAAIVHDIDDLLTEMYANELTPSHVLQPTREKVSRE
jgi:PAS domain S-box-containing protein